MVLANNKLKVKNNTLEEQLLNTLISIEKHIIILKQDLTNQGFIKKITSSSSNSNLEIANDNRRSKK